jgi:hypothetical protein
MLVHNHQRGLQLSAAFTPHIHLLYVHIQNVPFIRYYYTEQPFLFLFLWWGGGGWSQWFRYQLASIFGGRFFITKFEEIGVITTYKILKIVVKSAKIAANGL